MRKVLLISILLLVMFLVCFADCSRNKSVNGVVVSEQLITVSKEQHIKYCKLLKKAMNGDTDYIKQLSLLEFYDGVGYDHGSVIVDLIEVVGEDKFIQALSAINKEQKQTIESYVEAGLEYGNNPNVQGKTLNEAFPKIYTFLK